MKLDIIFVVDKDWVEEKEEQKLGLFTRASIFIFVILIFIILLLIQHYTLSGITNFFGSLAEMLEYQNK